MSSIEELESRVKDLEEMNANLTERVSELELQIAQITERVLHSCSSCGTF